MSTYQNYFNPEPPSNKWPNIILFICAAIVFGWIAFCLSSCNSVKKSTDIQINKVDSSSTQKIDSTVQEKKAISFDSSSLKTWDKETTIIFNNDLVYRYNGRDSIVTNDLVYRHDGNDTGFTIYPVNGFEDGLTKVKGRIKSITIREKGKDSTNLKKADNSESKVDLSKEGETKKTTKDKVKGTKKESDRVSTGLMVVGGIVVIAGIFFFLIYKRLK
jgi:hypothetical protein